MAMRRQAGTRPDLYASEVLRATEQIPPLAACDHVRRAADERVSGLIAWVSKCVAAAGGVCFSDGHGRIR